MQFVCIGWDGNLEPGKVESAPAVKARFAALVLVRLQRPFVHGEPVLVRGRWPVLH